MMMTLMTMTSTSSAGALTGVTYLTDTSSAVGKPVTASSQGSSQLFNFRTLAMGQPLSAHLVFYYRSDQESTYKILELN